MMTRRRPRSRWRLLALLLALLAGATLAAGCGKKGPPRLPDAPAPEGVTDLAATREGDVIVLRWTGFKAAGYQVYRSAESQDEAPCEGCPVLFERAAKVPLSGEGQSPQRLTYREPSLPGTRYRFKVVPYDAQGQLGTDSNIVSIMAE